MLLSLILAAAVDGPLQQAQSLESSSDDAGALKVLNAAVVADPTWAMGRLELGRLTLKLGQSPEAAEVHLEVARSLAPENPRAHYLFALASDERGRRREAVRALEVALALREDYADARYRLAGMVFVDGDYARAAREYGLYVALHPEATGARLQLALAFERSGDAGQAERELRSLLQVPSSRAMAGQRLVELLERQGRRADAQKVREKLDPPRRALRELPPSRR